MMKDHSRDHLVARDSIVANVELINKYTTELQRNICELQEMITILSWYINAERAKIDMHYNDSPLEHLNKVGYAYSEYCGDLVNMDTTIRQCIFVLGRRFHFDSDEIALVKRRVEGDR
jgi:hypothetical protein